jgi:hypothetical protein
MPIIAALLSLLLASQPAQPAVPGPNLAGRWAVAACAAHPPGYGALLNGDGTYVEAGGGGRWHVAQGMLVIEVIAPPTIAFESRAPELLALDADHRLRILGPNLLEAEANGFVRLFHRCT